MFESLKNYISEFERIGDKGKSAEKFTVEEQLFIQYSNINLALALLEVEGCNIRKVAKIILAETED